MKKPEDLKPEFEGTLSTRGDSLALTMPIGMAKLWGLEKGKRYRFIVLEEIAGNEPARKCGLRAIGSFLLHYT